MTEEEVAEAELLPDVDQCHHVYPNAGRCHHPSIGGLPFCGQHLSKLTLKEIRLVRGDDVSFGELVGRKVENPFEELSELVSEVLLYKDYCARRVAELRDNVRYEGKAGEQLRAEVSLYERSLDRCGKLLVDWSRLNIDDRLARIEERKAALILEVIREALAKVALTDDARRTVEQHIIAGLRRLAKQPGKAGF